MLSTIATIIDKLAEMKPKAWAIIDIIEILTLSSAI